MCGILISNINTALFKKALNQQSFRGPDGNKTYKFDKIMLGFNYLSITGKKKNYWQPYKLKNYILLFNGEIYNYKELNKEIKKVNKNFKSDSDTKTLINYFLNFGFEKNLKNLRGMWSLCLLDTEKKILYFSRDRLGIKPLYYYRDKNKFIFSSSIRSINCLLKKRKINHAYLKNYLTHGHLDNSELTPFNNILNFPSASFLKINLNNKKNINFKFNKFWKLSQKEIKNINDTTNFKKLIDKNFLLHGDIQKRVKTVIPLSSGLDSSFIQKKNITKNYISISLSGNFFNEEVSMIKKFVEDEKLNHVFLEIKKKDYSFQKLKKFIEKLDQPIRSLNPYFQYLIRKKAKSYNAKVLQNGDGGDEVFGGYFYALQYVLNFYNKKSNSKLKNLKLNFLNEFAEELSKKNLSKKNSKKIELKEFLVNRILKTHIPYWLRVDDEISMLNSIENRVPYLDHKILDFCMSIKSQYFYKKGLNKFFFRETIKKELPKYILNQRKIGKPGSSYIITYTLLKKEILKIIDTNFLKKYIRFSKTRIKTFFIEDVNKKNHLKADYWFRVFFLYYWLKKNEKH